jgi:hypothetical protein
LFPPPKLLSNIPADFAGGIALHFVHGDAKYPANHAFREAFSEKH